MNAIDAAMKNVLEQMPKDELEVLVYYAEDRGLDGIVERGGGAYRKLASRERVQIEMSLGALLQTANDVGELVAGVGYEILEEDDINEEQ